MAIDPTSAGNMPILQTGASRPRTQGAPGAAPAGSTMSIPRLQEVLAQSARAESQMMQQWQGISRGGDPLSNTIEAIAVAHMDPSLAAELNPAPMSGRGLPSMESMEAFAVSQLDPSLAADLRATKDPFGLSGARGGPPSASQQQMALMEQIAFVNMDPGLRSALLGVIQLNPG